VDVGDGRPPRPFSPPGSGPTAVGHVIADDNNNNNDNDNNNNNNDNDKNDNNNDNDKNVIG